MTAHKHYQPQTPYDNSPRSFARFNYLDAPRQPLTAETLTYENIGALLETYVDALHVALLMDEPSFLRKIAEPDGYRRIREVVFTRPNKVQPPRYVADAIGDYRAAKSFFRRDNIGGAREPARQDHKQPDATQLAQELHAQARRIPQDYIKHYKIHFFPPEGEGHRMHAAERNRRKDHNPAIAIRGFMRRIREYEKLYKQFSAREEARLKQEEEQSGQKLPIKQRAGKILEAFKKSPELREYNLLLSETINEVKAVLSPPALPHFYLRYGDQTLVIDNSRPVNPAFNASYPALLATSMRLIGKHGIDATFFPKQGFDFFMDIVGVESEIHNNVEALHRHISDAMRKRGVLPNDDLLFGALEKKDFIDATRQYARGIKLLYHFHKTAGLLDKIYSPDKRDIAYRDMERLLALAGQTPAMKVLETPKEIACMLYAVDRRLNREEETRHAMKSIRTELRNLANGIGNENSFTRLSGRTKQRTLKALELIKQDAKRWDALKDVLNPAFTLITSALENIPDRASHPDIYRNPPESELQL